MIRWIVALILLFNLSVAHAESHYLLDSVNNLNPKFEKYPATPHPQPGAWSKDRRERDDELKHKQSINLLGQLVVLHDYFWGMGTNREHIEIVNAKGNAVDLAAFNNKVAKVIYQSRTKQNFERLVITLQLVETNETITITCWNDWSGPPFVLLRDLVEIENKYLGKDVWLALPWWYEKGTIIGGTTVAVGTKARVTKVEPSGDPHHPVSIYLDNDHYVDVRVTPLWAERVWTLGPDAHLLLEDPFANLPATTKTAILNKQVLPGMNEKQVVLAWGVPHYLKTTNNPHLKYWHWYTDRYVLLRDGIVEQAAPGARS